MPAIPPNLPTYGDPPIGGMAPSYRRTVRIPGCASWPNTACIACLLLFPNTTPPSRVGRARCVRFGLRVRTGTGGVAALR